ncbi:MAG: hypothetical protein GF315_07715 [candidate division Zixibacteria bacterium]|nr:hypothetical protein [candidate division Zixibacteria bacterium]
MIANRDNSTDMDSYLIVVLPWLEKMYSISLNIYRDKKDAEKLVSDTYVEGFKKFRNYGVWDEPGVWLFRIYYNKFNETNGRADDNLNISASPDPPETTETLRSGFEWDKVKSAIREHVDVNDLMFSVPLEERLPLLLSLIGGFNYGQICSIVQEDCNSVRKAIRKANITISRSVFDSVASESKGIQRN